MSMLSLDQGREFIRRARREVKILFPWTVNMRGALRKKEPQPHTRARLREISDLTVLYWILTSICFGLASSFLGSVRRNIPSLNSALMAPVSTLGGKVNDL